MKGAVGEVDRLSELAVLVTGHPRQQRFWDLAFESWAGYRGFMLLMYDDITTERIDDFCESLRQDGLNLRVVPGGYEKGYLGHVRGELLLMQKGGLILRDSGYRYLYKTAADTAHFRHYNIRRLFNALGKADFVLCGTAAIFGKLEAFNKCMELYHPAFRCGGAELYFDSQITKFSMGARRERGPWWEDLLGRIHIQGEYALCHGMSIEDTWNVGEIWQP